MRVTIKTTDEGEYYFVIPNEYLKNLGWHEGDDIVWTENDDGSLSLSKSNDVP